MLWRRTSCPSSELPVYKLTLASDAIEILASDNAPFIDAATVSWANRGPILSAISNGVIPAAYDRVDLSGKVIVILLIE